MNSNTQMVIYTIDVQDLMHLEIPVPVDSQGNLDYSAGDCIANQRAAQIISKAFNIKHKVKIKPTCISF